MKIVLILVGIILISGCAGIESKKSIDSIGNVITIDNNNYTPSYLATNKGEEVAWINSDTMSHVVKSITGEFDSGIVQPGNIFIYRFNVSGPYGYYCTIHDDMIHGKIVVGQ